MNICQPISGPSILGSTAPAQRVASPNQVASQRLSQLLRFRSLRKAGLTAAEAAAAVGLGVTTLWRYARVFDAVGFGGLKPRRPTGRSGPDRRLQQTRSHAAAIGSLRTLGLSDRDALLEYASSTSCPRSLVEVAAGIKPAGRTRPPVIQWPERN
jgi:hypothetical protein